MVFSRLLRRPARARDRVRLDRPRDPLLAALHGASTERYRHQRERMDRGLPGVARQLRRVLLFAQRHGADRVIVSHLPLRSAATSAATPWECSGKHPRPGHQSEEVLGRLRRLGPGLPARRVADHRLAPRHPPLAGAARRPRGRRRGHAGRPRRVDAQARPGPQGHGPAAARARRHDGPSRLTRPRGAGGLRPALAVRRTLTRAHHTRAS